MWLVLLACGGTRPDDDDGDGWLSNRDCDDQNPFINPGVAEIPGDGINNDCNLATEDGDFDQDGFVGLDDCDDRNPNIPVPFETPYDGFDNDCDPATLDDDLDQDGSPQILDCDDENPTVRPGLPETPYDGFDNDCDPLTSDTDADGDGLDADVDCDDDNPFVQGDTTWYADCDGDGFAAVGAATTFACTPAHPSCGGSGFWTSIEPLGTPSHPSNDRIDCADLNANAFPGQNAYFENGQSAVSQPWDYNCDGLQEPEHLEYTCDTAAGTTFCDAYEGFVTEDLGCGDIGDFSDACTVDQGVCEAHALEARINRCR